MLKVPCRVQAKFAHCNGQIANYKLLPFAIKFLSLNSALVRMLVDTLLDLDYNFGNSSDISDEELAVLAKNNKSAAEALVLRYLKPVLIKSEIYANSHTDSEDLRQEGLMSLLSAINSYDPSRGVKFSTYSEVCVTNRMRSFLTQKGRTSSLTRSLDDVSECDILSVEEDPESICLFRETISEVRRVANSELSRTERRTLGLCAQGLSYRCAAEKLGVKPVANRTDAEKRKNELVYVGGNPFFYVEPLQQSIPYLVPKAAILLQDIGHHFMDSLQIKQVPMHKIRVTSVLRTKEDVEKLRKRNRNATENSCHLYGTTFDISYTRYVTVSDPDGAQRRAVQNDTLKYVLSEVLRDLREQNRCFIKYEVKQACFHITVR